MSNIQNSIHTLLGGIEKDQGVKILYACESGSRVWGFASPDSDYDVRFIYMHPIDWYLSINDQRDIIEPTARDSRIDASGWDLRKALRLMRKSNPPLLEWLLSPTVYRTSNGAKELWNLSRSLYSPRRCAYHYYHMAKGNYWEYLQGETVSLKKYLYVIRPLFAMRWAEKCDSFPPIRFDDLIQQTPLPTMWNPSRREELRLKIASLVSKKTQRSEADRVSRLPILNEFIEYELERRAHGFRDLRDTSADVIVLLNNAFRVILRRGVCDE